MVVETGYSDVGTCCLAAGYSWLMVDNPVSENGILVYWQVNSSGGNSGTAKLKIFRDDGTNYLFIGESSAINVDANGIFSGSCNITVKKGDIIGVYINTASLGIFHGGTSLYYKGGDITSDSVKNTWTLSGTNRGISIYARGVIIYINSSTGNDSNVGDSCAVGHPVLTFAQAYSLISYNDEIRICNDGADFSGENITFTKPYSIAQGATGVTNCKLPRFN